MQVEGLWQPLVFAVLAGCAFAPLEWLVPERRADPSVDAQFDARARVRTDALFATLGAVLTQLLLAATMGVALAGVARVHALQLELPDWAALPLALVVFELAGYGYHRCAHVVPALWRLHAVHHSAPRMDWLASFRQHPVEIVLMTLVQNVPLVLLGIPLGAHALVVVLLALNTVFVHANLRVGRGWVRHLIATPSFHHRHHDRLGAAKNFASLLPVIDRVFGSHSDQRARSFGTVEALPRGFVGLLLSPLRRRG